MEEDFKKDGGSWKNFKIGDLFDSSNGNTDIQQIHINGKGYPVVSSGLSNMGIIGLSDIEAKIFDENTITVDMFGNVQFRDFKYKMVTHARVFSLKYKNKSLKYKEGIYLATQFFYFCKLFSYSDMASWEKIKDIEISLPIQSGEIAFNFMEAYISELEEERVSELAAYLKVSGLENYELNENEKKALNSFKTGEIKISKRKISEVFELKSSAKKYNAIDVKFNGIYPYVARGNSNNGIRGYITEDIKFLNEANTISFGQDTATMFYQENTYFTGDKIKILILKNKLLNEKIASFLITCMRKSFSIFSWGTSSFSEKVINSTVINLPINNKNEIDYTFMETYIKAIEKLSIKSLIEYKDEIIKNTKEIVKERNKND